MREHQRRPPGIGDDLRHRHRLARTGDAAKRYVTLAPRKRVCEARRRGGLVAGEIPRQNKPKGRLRGRSVEWDLERLAMGHACLILEQAFWYEIAARSCFHCRASTPV